MVHTIADLRKMAELNLPPESFQMYLAVIEPGIEAMLKEYFKGWQTFEAFLSMSVMRHSGVFKDSIGVIQVDEDEMTKFGDQIDVEKYKKLQNMSVFALIEYLYEHGLIGPSTHEFFHLVRKRRNTIHTYDGVLTDEDRADFEWAASLAHHVYLGLSGTKLYDSYDSMKQAMENTATSLLPGIRKREVKTGTFMFQSTKVQVQQKSHDGSRFNGLSD